MVRVLVTKMVMVVVGKDCCVVEDEVKDMVGVVTEIVVVVSREVYCVEKEVTKMVRVVTERVVEEIA